MAGRKVRAGRDRSASGPEGVRWFHRLAQGVPLRALRAALGAALLLATPAAAVGQEGSDARPSLRFPVLCAYGTDCWVQNHVDTQPGPGASDYRCGHLTYNGHGGTDIRLRDLVQMRGGVDVVAAAPGVVRAIRDGMPDVGLDGRDRASLTGREAGNGVAIRHPGGWETQYSHLTRGSVQVREGARVQAGTKLGEVGLSGVTEFPHVEFIVRRNGAEVDPFTGSAPEQGCSTRGTPLWRAAARDRLAYIPTALLSAGLAPTRPRAKNARESRYRDAKIGPGSAVLTFWARVMGPQTGDRQTLQLRGPSGRVIAEDTARLPRDQARRFGYVGRRRPDGGWPAGCYVGSYTLIRDGRTVVDARRRIGIGTSCER